MAATWPAVADVKAFLRLTDTTDDALVASELAAAIAWVTDRVDPKYIPGSATYPTPAPTPPLADPLYAAALHEAGRLYRRRDSVDGTMGWGDMGVVRVGPKDPDIETMLAPYLNVIIG